MTGRTIEISSASRLSLRNRQLLISRGGSDPASVPVEDVAMLIVDHPETTYTHGLLTALAEAKCALIVCGRDHLPVAAMLPYAANAVIGERLRAQLACPRPLAKRLWQAIVACKLKRQADLLVIASGSDCGLRALASRVRSGDPDNLEAQGAQRYWPRLLGGDFRREKAGAGGANRLLNYGYAVLRAATARSLAAAGLLPGVGLFHSNRGDAFALASDMMEPFRPFVDGVVWELRRAGLDDGELDRTLKGHLLAVLNLGVAMDGQTLPLSLALQRAAASLAESFGRGKFCLRLPEGPSGLPPSDGDWIDAAAPPAA